MKTKMLFWCACAGLIAGLSFFTVSCNNNDDPQPEPQPEPTLSISKTPITATLQGGTFTVTVTSNTDWTVTSSKTEVATVTPTSGNGNGDITVSVSANTGTEERTATITVSAGTLSESVAVTQAANASGEIVLTVAPASTTTTAAAGTQAITVTTNTGWTAVSDQTWATIAPTSGTNNGTITATLAENTTETARTAIITVTAGAKTGTVSITQQGKAGADPTTMQGFTGAGASIGDTWTLRDTRDDKEYTVVKMKDGKIWMSKNLNYTKDLTDITDEIGPGLTYNSSLPGGTSEDTYACAEGDCDFWGAHYPQPVAQVVCPNGWILPGKDDWSGLLAALKAEYGSNFNVVMALGLPNDPNAEFDYWKWEHAYNNASKFSAIGSGSSHGESNYRHFQSIARFWASEAKNHAEWGNGSGDYIEIPNNDVANYFSVRCVKL